MERFGTLPSCDILEEGTAWNDSGEGTTRSPFCDILEEGTTRNDSEEGTTKNDSERHLLLQIEMHKYAFDHIKQSIPNEGDVTLLELVAKFDSMKYFREVGRKEWPSITMLARIHFSKMDNSAFQERVFSTAAYAQSKTQGRMKVDHLEKRTLISHNKDLIRDGII